MYIYIYSYIVHTLPWSSHSIASWLSRKWHIQKEMPLKRLLFAKYDHSCCGSMQARLSDNWCLRWSWLFGYHLGDTTDPGNPTITASFQCLYQPLLLACFRGIDDHPKNKQTCCIVLCPYEIISWGVFCGFISEFLFLTARFLVSYFCRVAMFLASIPMLHGEISVGVASAIFR